MKKKLVSLAVAGSLGTLGMGVSLALTATAAHACPAQSAPGWTVGPVYGGPGTSPVSGSTSGYIGVAGSSPAGGGYIEANGSAGAGGVTGYIVAAGSSPAGSGGVLISSGTPPTVAQC